MRYFSEKERIEKERWVVNYPRFIQNLYHKTKTVHDYYDDQLAPLINKEVVLLDAGCGDKGIMDKYKGKTKKAIGLDASQKALENNKSLDELVLGDLEELPFENESFDVVISQWTGEHLKYPKKVYKEFARVLKENGHLIIVTNSIYNPIMLISALLPVKFRDRMKEKAFPSEVYEDTFPTYYKCNTKKAFDKVLSNLGFSKIFAGYSGDFSIFLFSKPLFILLLLYEIITNLKFLNCFKMHIVVHYQKQCLQ